MKQYTAISLLIGITMLLSGCSGQEGVFHTVLVEPFIQLIKFFASFFNDSYGIGLIIVTLCVRLLIMPLMFHSFKKQKKMQFKMKKVKPEIDAINLKIKAAQTSEERTEYTQQMMQLYKQHEVNPLNMGCLPVLLQMPILYALYFAISHNDALSSQNFLWFNLGTPDIVMAVIAGMMYFIQSWLSMKYMPPEMQQQMKLMIYISPLMILFISFNSPAALPLYWAVGAVVLILQQYVSNKYFDYHEEKLE